MIAHIVLFSPKTDANAAQLRSCAQLLERICREIPHIRRASIGQAVAIDAGYPRVVGDKTYKNACVLEFADRPSLIAYLNHPLHKELGRVFWELCDSAVVLETEMVDAKTESVAGLLVL